MSLRTRLTLLIALLVTAAVGVAAVLFLNKYVGYSVQSLIEGTNATAQLVKLEVVSRASARLQSMNDPPQSLNDRSAVWQTAIQDDIELPGMLTQMMAPERSIVEVSVAGSDGRILTSSNPARRGQPMTGRPPLRLLGEMNLFERLQAIFKGNIDYESVADLGVQGKQRVFRIQLLSSPALLRTIVKEEIERTALILFITVALSTAFAYATAQVAYGPLTRLGMAIDRITSGMERENDEQLISSGREFALVQEKLRLLSEQFRGAQLGASEMRGNIQQILDRMETATVLFGRDGLLMMWSPAAERMLGKQRGELAGKRFDEVFPALAGHPFRERLRNHQVGELRVDVDPAPGGGALVRLSDPAGRELLETQLNLSSRLAAISRLTSGVAHEIKNPLNSIALHLELLRSMPLSEHPAAQEPLGVIAEEIARLDRVVRTFLDFTRPVELEMEPFDISEAVRSVGVLVGLEAQANGIELECLLPEAETGVTVRGDEGLIKQALMNVVRNAIDAMPYGGKLRLQVESKSEAVITVQDTGRGIPKEHREKIFQLYFTTKEKGSGIGLAMTYRAVQLHGGSMEVESEPGQGTTMRIRMPLLVGQEVPA